MPESERIPNVAPVDPFEGGDVSLRKRFFALTYDRQMVKVERAGLRAHREHLLSSLSGRVLEIGGGTGSNLSSYGVAVESLTITEPDPYMLRRLEARVREQMPTARVLRAPAEDLPFDDDAFDAVVSTLVLCGVDDQPRALREIYRILRPGGQLVFFEHVRSDDPKVARQQDRMNAVNRFVAGCECNRPTLESIRGAGFDVEVAAATLEKVPWFLRPSIVGHARVALTTKAGS
jgi:ubiquinone/menaquinone biosynthesis C-methylase UbiE